MAFHEVRFPATLSFGSLGGPERRTEIVAMVSGYEERNTPWAHGRRRFDAGMGLRSLDDLAEVVAFFEARAGQLHGFRWKDWTDFKSCPPSQLVAFDDQALGQGDGAQKLFPLVKSYASGPGFYSRPITKPVAGTVRVGLGGMEKALGQGVEIEIQSGLLRFDTAPAKGVMVTAGFEFDVPVRFDTDCIQISVTSFEAGEVPQIPVIEVRL